jgi:hypothetical protein
MALAISFVQLLKFKHLALEWKYTSIYHAWTRVSALVKVILVGWWMNCDKECFTEISYNLLPSVVLMSSVHQNLLQALKSPLRTIALE